MPSHAGRWNTERMMKLRDALDSFNTILLAPIYKKDHININIMGIYEEGSYNLDIPIIQIARTAPIKPKNNAKGLPANDKEGVFSLKAYDEDMLYGMGAFLSSLGFVVYFPKLIEAEVGISVKRNQKPKRYWVISQEVKFDCFAPNVEFAENKIVSIDLSHAINFCLTRKQPEINDL